MPELPPPEAFGFAPPAAPITATDSLSRSGNSPSAFFNSTVPCSAACKENAACSGVRTCEFQVPACGLSKSPKRNMVTRIRLTCSSSVASLTCPSINRSL